ncbi:MAG: hypothetical protein ABLQ96_05470, partial [Candidatus Acidiferrum sp.]
MRKAWIAALLAALTGVSGCGESSKEETIADPAPTKNTVPAQPATLAAAPATQNAATEKDDFVNVSGPL